MEHSHLESLYPENSRFEEIEKILEYVKRGDSCQAIAMPGVGRGNLLRFLAYNRNIRIKHLGEQQTQYHFVFVNFDEIKHRPVIDGLKFIFLELVSSLHERRLEDAFETTDKIFKDSLKYHDELVLSQGLKEAIDFLAHEKQLHIILLFERFEKYLPMLTPDFFAYIRSLRSKAKYKFSVVFSTTRPLEDTVESTILSDFFEFFAGHDVYLTLSDDPGIRFRIKYLEELTKRQLGQNYIEELLKLTAGHGKLTRLSVETILATPVISNKVRDPLTSSTTSGDLSSSPPRDDKNKLEKFLLSQKAIQAALKELWEFLTPAEQQYIILLTNSNNVIPAPFGLELTAEREAGIQKQETWEFLERIHLIKNNKITIPLFEIYIKEQNKTLKKQEKSIAYDSSTNTIRKGNLVISDLLTSSEFRLLRFLLENPQKVLEREEIINAVWKETASTLGVTDQALDQLIFRLRKKIEDNPNEPQHIQTVKGRGIQFTP